MEMQPSELPMRSVCAVCTLEPRHRARMADLAGSSATRARDSRSARGSRQLPILTNSAIYVAELPGGRIAGWIGADI
jgi:hypothetical protein